MSFFDYRDGILHAENVPLPAIAESVGTPVHVYSAGALREAADAFSEAVCQLPSVRLAFAVKANPNTAVLRLLGERGYGADIVSGGELRRALGAGMSASGIVFSGVGKTDRELTDALDAGIGQFNLELEEEGHVLARFAHGRGQRAPAVLRVNPDVDGGTARSSASAGRWEIMMSGETKFLPRRPTRLRGVRKVRPVRKQAVSSRRKAPRPWTKSAW